MALQQAVTNSEF